ncbi:hypothetical protein [Helicobacter sp. T3_23-1056]
MLLSLPQSTKKSLKQNPTQNLKRFVALAMFLPCFVFALTQSKAPSSNSQNPSKNPSQHISNVKQIQSFPDSSQDRLDVLLLLDSSFRGEVGSATIADERLSVISSVGLGTKWSKTFTDSPIAKLEIIPHNNNLYINAKGRKRYYLKPSISKDKSTLRLSFYAADSAMLDSLLSTPTTLKATPIEEVFSDIKNISTKLASKENPFAYTAENTASQKTDISLDSALQPKSNPQNPQNPKNAQNDSFFDWGAIAQGAEFNASDYALYLAVFASVIALLLFVRYIVRRGGSANASLKVVSQSQIDSKNKVVIFETKDYFYMVLLGEKNNILIDKIPRGGAKPLTVGSVLDSLGEPKNPTRLKTQPISKPATKSPLSAQVAPKQPIARTQTTPQAIAPKPSPLESLPIGNEHSFNQDFWDALKSGKR